MKNGASLLLFVVPTVSLTACARAIAGTAANPASASSAAREMLALSAIP